VNLNQVTLPSNNLWKACVFYRRLGLTQIVDALPRYARFECPGGGGATLSLHLTSTPIPRSEFPMVYLECPGLDSVCHDLAAAGFTFESGPTDQPWLWREARLRDPDGNALCLYWAGPNRRNPPWRLAASPQWRVACLCADWCAACREFRTLFESFQPRDGSVRLAWIDIDEDDHILEDLDLEGLPTLLIGNESQVLFAGPVVPRLEILHGLVTRAMRFELPPLGDERTVQWASRLLERLA
jgi:catechol 2,3-dioxygenase-like lactoylglutathione lyase family enzyme